jgi:energy-coupling factor transporter ATP-binding protein EcfA2
MLDLQDILKTFNPGTANEVRALRGVTLTLERGSFLIIIGTNGSGKSSVFALLRGELQAEHGLTVGHWPQSIALSTVGGWLACRGAGQLSNRYGKAQTEALHAEHARATAKHKKYDNDAAAQGATFVPLIMGVHGAVTPAFAQMVSRLHQAAALTGHANPPSTRRILATVVATMLKHHAQILAAGNKRIINSPPPKQ